MDIEKSERNCSKKSQIDDKKRSEFEYCKICKLNHDQGQRHKYFPSHKKSVSIVFSKFLTKLSDIRFFLKNPTPLRPEHASRNRLWCVFCDHDFHEVGSSFACNNAINHLASVDHLKNLKHFLWKYGGGTDFVDKFRITEAEFAKWEKKCKSLKNEAALSEKASCLLAVGPSNNIHNELNCVNTFIDCSNAHSINPRISNGVMPLQYNTNEYQVSSSKLGEVANAGVYLEHITSSFPLETYSGTSPITLNDPTGVQNFAQNLVRDVAGGNVHTGGPPPWLEAHEVNQLNLGLQTASASFVSESSKLGKSKKLNPKRVGAAWAERRKMEMELEKRGELVRSEYDVNWLPDFGRVWQSGTRKESRKEYELGKQNFTKVETLPAEPIKIQPYVSKRMQRDASK